ncbi:P-loop containing nucleoside triphosphate hydrolase protein, partial [Mycena sanguinolenta]
LPGSPQIFHGRESELEQTVDSLLTAPARVAILGPGGIGKTALAVAAVHNHKVADRYPSRHFIPCDSAISDDSLVSLTASHLGLDATRSSVNHIIHRLSKGPPCLVILDNFETPWEPVGTRGKVENFLSLLTDITHVALLITMRGAERPSKVQWSHPFLRPLGPLTSTAARQTFIEIVDECDNGQEVDQLLELADNMPLAVQLVAAAAASEGVRATLERWRLESVQLLSAGHDKRSNLELSIMLSLSSPRMLSSPHAFDLLSLMSLFSDGITDLDLGQSKIPIPGILDSKAILIRTSLAYVEPVGRFQVLAPIREYVHKNRPPSPMLVRPVRDHFNHLLALWRKNQLFDGDLIPRIVSNLGNLHNVLFHELNSDDADLRETIRGIILLNNLNVAMNRGLTSLMLRLPEALATLDDHQLQGQFITATFRAWQFYPLPHPQQSIDEAIEHFRMSKDPDSEGQSNK